MSSSHAQQILDAVAYQPGGNVAEITELCKDIPDTTTCAARLKQLTDRGNLTREKIDGRGFCYTINPEGRPLDERVPRAERPAATAQAKKPRAAKPAPVKTKRAAPAKPGKASKRAKLPKIARKSAGPDAAPGAVNDIQVGGAHYKALDPQPWDVIDAWGLSFLAGNVVKYVARAPAKGGLEDLQKARHYLDKLIENHGAGSRA